uniref:SDR family oxidoreductase n=1 Tax=Rhabditophanes sp. KR3021 TaxID=114890 RepID=A0AC35THM9_9BILA
MNVIAGCLTEHGIKGLIEECNSLAGDLYAISLDVTKQESVDEAFAFVSNLMDEKNTTLWSVVNNAGINRFKGPSDWCEIKDFEDLIAVNLMGPIRVCQTFLPLLKKSKGRFVTMISCNGRVHNFYCAPYTTSKFGLEGYMASLRVDMQIFGIGVSILEPGAFKTPLTQDSGLGDRINTVWNNLDKQVRQDYGVAFKDNLAMSYHRGVNTIACDDLSKVVNCYVHAITAVSPKKRYVIGKDASIIFIPLSYLSPSVQDKILTLLFKRMAITPAMHMKKSAVNALLSETAS